MDENHPPARNQGMAPQSTSGPTGRGGGDPENRRVSVVVAPDRQQQPMSGDNSRRTLGQPNVASNKPRVSVVQQPTISEISIPDKFRKAPKTRGQMLAQFQHLQTVEMSVPVVAAATIGTTMETGKTQRSSAPEAAWLGGRKSTSGTTGRLPPPPPRKLSKAEVEEYYTRIKTVNTFRKSESSSSLTSYNSTSSSVSSSVSSPPYSPTGLDLGGGGLDWSERWVVDRAGRQPGQIRGVRDVCFVSGAKSVVAVTESRNSRIQIFSTSGKSLAVLGADSDNDRTAASFNNPVSFRKMEPTGICESRVDGILAVTDHSRLVYIDSSDTGRLLTEITVDNRNCLHGIASTPDDKLIITEVGTQASVGLYESNGRIIREYKGDFKHPAYVAWNNDLGIVAVADSEQRAVYLYDANGCLLNKLSKQLGSRRGDDEVGPLVYPSGVAWFSEGRLLVADRAENRVVLVDLKNMQAENLLTDQNGLGHPVAIATNQKNRIVLTEEYHDFGVDKYNLKMFKLRSPNNDGDF